MTRTECNVKSASFLSTAMSSLRRDGLAWHYAAARMTISGTTVKHKDRVAWECSFIEPGVNEFDTWTYFQTYRDSIRKKP
jgi:hypothetical protein